MVFQALADKIQQALKKLKGKGKLTEKDVTEALREVRLALLEADVSLPVVKDFVQRVKEKATDSEVLASLTPAQQIVKIVHEELTQLMGGAPSRVNLNPAGATVFMLVGLHGSGKTTTAGKLALYFKKQGKHPLLVAADVYRPAAGKQLAVLGEQVGVPVFGLELRDPREIARACLGEARRLGCNLVLVDTAGRLHIDAALMEELRALKEILQPHEVILVVDAMTGQDAVNIAKSFHEQLGLTGVILTKLDGDTRGGAALSVKAVTGCPIKFAGVGEKLDALEAFHPERMASRILGMGDVLTLIEKVQAGFDAAQARALEEKLRKQEFTLEDFRDQLRQMRALGPLDQLLGLLPGFGDAKHLRALQEGFDEKELIRIEAIINSMTPEERRHPEIINGSRRRRIARGSGTTVQDVNRLLRQFEQARRLLKHLSDAGTGKGGKKRRGFRFPFL